MSAQTFALALGALLAGMTTLAQAETPSPPNIVFILIDDLGAHDPGCTGSTFHRTPQIDALARSGMRFTSAYAAAPVCSPTRASILTGKYPPRLGITDWIPGENRSERLESVPNARQLALEERTIAEVLHDAGYRTGFVGKWHLGGKGFRPEDQGFDSNVAGNSWGHPHGGYFSPYGMENLEDGPEGEYLADRLGSEAVAFLERHHDDGPFFLYFCPYVVHTPIQVKPEMRKRYQQALEDLPPAERDPGFIRERDAHTRRRQSDPAYAAMVESMDTNVGRVLATLDEFDLADDTIVVFTSDNGGLSTAGGKGSCKTANTPLRAGKGWCYEGGIREPLIVRWPGVTQAGSTCPVPVTSMDFYPTLLEMAGLPLLPEQHIDGLGLATLLRGGDSLEREALYWHYPHYHGSGHRPSSAVRAGDWKLMHFLEDDSVELYDLAADPGESHDLAAENPEKAAELRKLLDAWREEVGARIPRVARGR